MRRHALQIFRAALRAADPYRAVRTRLKLDRRYEHIYVVGAGKAGAAMARAVEGVLGSRISGGLVNVPDGPAPQLRRIALNPCRHPIPDQRGVKGAQRILELAQRAGPGDLVLCLISGGASALMPLPSAPLTLEQKQKITRRLLRAGATIHEMNAVRKHLSRIKGGQLAKAAWPANVRTLILSDVVGDDPGVIGSGPTVADESTRGDALRILEKYGIPVPLAALRETPKPGDPEMARSRHVLVGSNREAIRAAALAAKRLGYRTLTLSTSMEGETREIAAAHAAIAREVLSSGHPLRPPACLLSGGETTVAVRGRGLGGRNQEFVLAAALALEGAGPLTILSCGTDGIDGPTDAAGAIADSTTLARAAKRGLDPRRFLDDNDSYHFFEPLHALIKTGPTGTNVMDIHVFLIPKPAR